MREQKDLPHNRCPSQDASAFFTLPSPSFLPPHRIELCNFYAFCISSRPHRGSESSRTRVFSPRVLSGFFVLPPSTPPTIRVELSAGTLTTLCFVTLRSRRQVAVNGNVVHFTVSCTERVERTDPKVSVVSSAVPSAKCSHFSRRQRGGRT